MREARDTDRIAGIGHNQPPNDDENDLDDVLQSVTEVREELKKDNAEDAASLKVIHKAETRFANFRTWILEQLVNMPSKVLAGVATGIGSAVTIHVLNQSGILDHLNPAIATLSAWAMNLILS